MGNIELDYVKILDEKNRERLNLIMDFHWNKCRIEKVWVKQNGERCPFDKLDSYHLFTIIKMLQRFVKERYSPQLIALIKALLDEAESRVTTDKRKNCNNTDCTDCPFDKGGALCIYSKEHPKVYFEDVTKEVIDEIRSIKYSRN